MAEVFNPIAGLGDSLMNGFSVGQKWAHDRASVDLQRQRIQMEQEQFQERRREFQVQVGKQVFEMMSDAAMEGPGPVRKAKIKKIEQFAQQAQLPMDPTWLASLEDENYRPKYTSLFKALGGADAEVAGQFFEETYGNLPREVHSSLLDKTISNITMAQAAQLRAAATKDAARIRGEQTAGREEARDRRQQNQIDAANHRIVVNNIQKNPELKQRFNQFYNLDNALTNFLRADHKDPSAFDELQQAVRANLGIKGQSGVIEREKTYIDNIEMGIQRAKRYVTSGAGNLDVNNEAIRHVIQLAQLEQENIARAYQEKLDTLGEGFGSMYERRQDLRGDLGKLMGKHQTMLKSAKSEEAKKAAATTEAPKEFTPAQIQNAMAAKKMLDDPNLDPKKRAKYLLQIQQKVSPELRKKVGLP